MAPDDAFIAPRRSKSSDSGCDARAIRNGHPTRVAQLAYACVERSRELTLAPVQVRATSDLDPDDVIDHIE
jgi:hypothetical protein